MNNMKSCQEFVKQNVEKTCPTNYNKVNKFAKVNQNKFSRNKSDYLHFNKTHVQPITTSKIV